ncbi:uncharacterized protein LOC125056822 [Pieris napi]|uniref:uncharacterized protein LOC125056822 n=1 Tax=Pieris napi TaxID=78633 RepID=UPI001FBC0B36|nr:uncharacterized protein LOC125056822 [Pieris napi]
MKLSEGETLKLVQLYGENECLWDIKSLNYRNKEMRSTALQNMAQQMQIEGLTSTEVKNKIKAIRATYYLELDKIQKSTKSGASGNVYVPKVKWFQELDGFIKNAIVKRKTMDNSGTSNDDAELGEAEGVGDGAENVSRSTENNDNSTETPTQAIQTPVRHSGPPRSKRSKISQMAAMIKDLKSMSNDVNMSPSEEESDADIFGKHVAAQLKKLSEEQYVIAQEEIQKILSKARLADIQQKKYTENAQSSSPNYFIPSLHNNKQHK